MATERSRNELPTVLHAVLYVGLLVALGALTIVFIPRAVVMVLLIIFAGVFLQRRFWARPEKGATSAAPVRGRPVIFQLQTLILLGLVLALGFLVVEPLTQIFEGSFNTSRDPFDEPARFGFENWRAALDGGMLEALRNTVSVTLARQAIAIPVAILVAWLITRTDMPGRRWLEFPFWIALFLPPVAVAQAWITLAGPDVGMINKALEALPFVDEGRLSIYSYWGIVWVHLAKTIPVNVVVLTFAFRRMGALLANAAQSPDSERRPTLIPAALLTLVAAVTLSEFWATRGIGADFVLGVPNGYFVFGSKMFELVTSSALPAYGLATALGAVALIIAVPLVILFRWAIRSRYFAFFGNQSHPEPSPLRQWRWPSSWLVAGLGLGMILVPLIALLVSSFMTKAGFFDATTWTLAHWQFVLAEPTSLRSMRNALFLAFGAATLSALAFAPLAYVSVRAKSGLLREVIDLLTWLPFAFPAIVLGVAWLFILLQNSSLTSAYGTMRSLILVSALGGMTIGVQLVKASLLPMQAESEEAASSNGARWFAGLFKMPVPRLAPAIALVWVLSFVAAAGTAGAIPLLTGRGSYPLAVLALDLVSTVEARGIPTASAVGVMLVLLTIGVVIVTGSALTTESRKNWYLEGLKKYSMFSGRAHRQEFWMFNLLSSIIGIGPAFIDGITGIPALGIYVFLVFPPGLGVSVRRLHDTSHSGWWVLISLVPLVGALVLLVFYVTSSDARENEYGPSPKAAAA